MGLKVYVASKFEEKERVREVMNLLRAVGHEITHDWTQVEQFTRLAAMKDLRGVTDADVLVGIFEKPLKYKGAYVELGAALALGKPVYILGDAARKCIFLKHPNVRLGQAAFDRDLVMGLI